MPDEQLHFDGVEPARMTRHHKPKPMHEPTMADVVALRAWLANETAIPGTLPRNLNFDQLKKVRARLTITADERRRLHDLADKWERQIEER